jgi:protein-S-isoprenylcysteine O-methyltransferase Ste14
MYVGVVLVLFSEGLLFSSPRLLKYALLVGAGFFLFVVAYEEPTLRRKFGASYHTYCQAVPRWIPRLTPWSPGG